MQVPQNDILNDRRPLAPLANIVRVEQRVH